MRLSAVRCRLIADHQSLFTFVVPPPAVEAAGEAAGEAAEAGSGADGEQGGPLTYGAVGSIASWRRVRPMTAPKSFALMASGDGPDHHKGGTISRSRQRDHDQRVPWRRLHRRGSRIKRGQSQAT